LRSLLDPPDSPLSPIAWPNSVPIFVYFSWEREKRGETGESRGEERRGEERRGEERSGAERRGESEEKEREEKREEKREMRRKEEEKKKSFCTHYKGIKEEGRQRGGRQKKSELQCAY
jgi:hypothetical protein